MNSLKRNKRPLYFCKRDDSKPYESFEEPVKYMFNYRKVSDEMRLQAFGELSGSFLIIKDRVENISNISVGDRVYLKEPVDYDGDLVNSDYVVSSKSIGLDVGEIMLKSLVDTNG